MINGKENGSYYTGLHMGYIVIYELSSKLLVSPLITPVVVPYIITHITPLQGV